METTKITEEEKNIITQREENVAIFQGADFTKITFEKFQEVGNPHLDSTGRAWCVTLCGEGVLFFAHEDDAQKVTDAIEILLISPTDDEEAEMNVDTENEGEKT